MLSARAIPVMLLAVFSSPQATQPRRPPVRERFLPNVAIQLEPGVHSSNDLPATFSVVLINLTPGELRIPKPALNCADPNVGSIYFNLGVHYGASGHECKVDAIHSPLEDRIQSWTLLHAGESLRIDDLPLPKESNYLLAGTYSFMATYDPPVIENEVRKAMLRQGISLPNSRLTSDTIQLKKEPKN